MAFIIALYISGRLEDAGTWGWAGLAAAIRMVETFLDTFVASFFSHV